MAFWENAVTQNSETKTGKAIAVRLSGDHIRSMRRYNQRAAIFRGALPAGFKIADVGSHHEVSYKQFPTVANINASFWEGMRSVDFFPSTISVLEKIEPNGLMADWVNIGKDMRKSMKVIDAEIETSEIDAA